jgi:hypothetical protein
VYSATSRTFRRYSLFAPMHVWSVMLGTGWDAIAHAESPGSTTRHVVT